MSSIPRLAQSLLIILAVAAVAAAQDIRNPQSAIDNRMRTDLRVDPVSHALQFQIPLGQYAGRAGASLPITLYYSSKLWNIKYLNTIQCQDDPGSLYFAEYAKSSVSGWTSSLDWFSWPVDISLELYDGYTTRPKNSGTLLHKIARMHITLPDGSRHELRKDDDFHEYNETITGLFYSVDGSRLIYDTATSTLYLPDGSRYIATSSGQTYIDRNGNQLNYNSTNRQWTDTLGRTIGLPLPSGNGSTETDYTYSIPGVGNTSLNYTLRWKHLSTAGVINEQESNQTLRYKGDHTTNCQSGTDYSGLFHSAEANYDGILKSTIFDPVVLYQIVLPTGQAYTFKYNIYGEITKVIYPTGGYERFGFGQAPLLSAEDAIGIYSQANRGVTDAWISADGTTASEAHWTYSGFSTTTPDGTRTDRSVFTNSQDWSAYGFEDPRLGMVYDERTYSPGGQMLRRKLTDYAVDGQAVQYAGYWAYKQRNPRPTKEVDILLDTGGNPLTTTTTHQYDADLNPTVTNHFDFASVDQTTAQTGVIASMPQGALLRTEEATFLVNDPNIDAGIRAAYRARNLLSLPTSTRIKDGAGNIVAQSSIGYDETLLQTIGTATGWTDPQTAYRGNATSTSNWLNTTNSYLSIHATYDQFGNVRTTTDRNGNQSQLDYSIAYQYAYPTTATSAIPDSTGQHGSTTPFVTTSVFDFNTGLTTSTIDPNGVTTNLEYNDPLDRLTRTVRAVGTTVQSQTVVAYDDVNRLITTTSDQNTFNDSNPLKTQIVYDSLGRTIESRQYEGGTNYIAVQTQYDAMGRAFKTSNPFRPSETVVWTTSGFDALGRVTSVSMPDSAVVSTSYLGNTVTVTDQANRVRRSVTNGLGQLVRVDEPDKNSGSLDDQGGNPIQSTSYVYDVLGNLQYVYQEAQTRTFTYDSLSRLLTAQNPESATVSYQYDDNGNLLVKSDARGVSAHYAYDALNRPLRRWYNGSSLLTATTNNSPALPASVASSDEANYVYDSTSIPNSKGRLTSVSSNASTYNYTNYDALGRVKTASQGIGAQTYSMSYNYDLAGHLKTMFYPSGHKVDYSYDDAGRTNTFTGNIGDGFFRTYANSFSYSPFGGMQQEQFGTTTPLYHKLRYNIRGQLYDVRLSTLSQQTYPDDWNRGCLAFYYGGAAFGQSSTSNNGNLTMQQHWVPTDDPNTYSYTQDTYTYDKLNRLGSVSELHGGQWGQSAQDYAQIYDYDRYGNRTINGATSAVVNNRQFVVDTTNNRLGIPNGQSGTMSYDNAGNLTTDTYSGAAVTRAYDAENRMTQETTWNNVPAGQYTYDADGRRVKRLVGNTETWQVYGIDGELLAEYAASGDPSRPQKEYGYRSGQLLITAESGVALGVAPTGLAETTATSSSITVSWSATTGATNYRIERKDRNASFAYVDHSATPSWTNNVTTGSAYLYRVCAADASNNCTSSYSNITLGVAVTFPEAIVGLSETANPANATTIKASHISELRAAVNAVRYLAVVGDGVWSHPANSGDPIYVEDVRELRTQLNQALTVLHLETPPFTDPTLIGVHEDAAHATPVRAVHIRELRQRLTATIGSSCYKSVEQFVKDFYQGVLQRQPNTSELSQWTNTLESAQSGGSSALVTAAQNLGAALFSSSEYANLGTSDSQFITDLYVGFLQRQPDSSGHQWWLDEMQGHHPPYQVRPRTDLITAFQTSGEFIQNVAALCRTAGGGSTVGSVHWLVADQLGTPRMIVDASGSLASVTRHDYLPFGEELGQGIGNRGSSYTSVDGARQKFTEKERDNETGLDYFGARYFSSTQGRFTSPDEPLIGQDEPDPQTWNLYSYTSNNPLSRVDEDGRRWFYRKTDHGTEAQWVNPQEDGSYCPPPGEGWQEFIPTKERPRLILYSPDGYQAYYLGENEDGSPYARSYATGKVEEKPDHILAAAFILQDLFNLARASFTAWQAARVAATEQIKISATEAGASTLEQQVVKTTAGKITGFTKHGINQAISRDGVGVSTRAIADAVKNPIKVVAGRGGATKFIGRDATVVLNKAGKVITTWARNSAGRRM